MDGFDRLFIYEFCVSAGAWISLISLFAGIFSAGARACQGGMNGIGWRYGLTAIRYWAMAGRLWGETLRCAATRRVTSGMSADMRTDYLEKTGLFTVKIRNRCRVFQCSVNWSRARHVLVFIAVGAAASSSICSGASGLLILFAGGGIEQWYIGWGEFSQHCWQANSATRQRCYTIVLLIGLWKGDLVQESRTGLALSGKPNSGTPERDRGTVREIFLSVSCSR